MSEPAIVALQDILRNYPCMAVLKSLEIAMGREAHAALQRGEDQMAVDWRCLADRVQELSDPDRGLQAKRLTVRWRPPGSR